VVLWGSPVTTPNSRKLGGTVEQGWKLPSPLHGRELTDEEIVEHMMLPRLLECSRCIEGAVAE